MPPEDIFIDTDPRCQVFCDIVCPDHVSEEPEASDMHQQYDCDNDQENVPFHDQFPI